MCGIAGTVGIEESRARAAVEAMCDRMVARGPDAAGIVAVGPVVLGARRLAVIDPSSAGDQPMHDPARRTTIVFNGHVSNFRALRRDLESAGERFTSECDTEVVLRAYGRWGASCVDRLRGMFAFALWDDRRRELVLARDALGVKPLYYRLDGGRLVFASQVRPLVATGLVPRTLSPAAIASYLSLGSVSEPETAVDGVLALPAGHVARFVEGRLELRRYWQPPLPETAATGDAAGELRDRLAAVVRDHLVSDVPLGVFLSGGLDSSLLAALAKAEGGDVHTICVDFDEAGFSEAEHARLVADRLGTEHSEVRFSAADLLDSLAPAFSAMDQPSIDGLNSFVVAGAARAAGLTVAVSGLGGDELFDGYGHAARVRRLEQLRRLPRPLRQPTAAVLAARRPKAAAWLDGSIERGRSHELLRRILLPADVSRLVGEQAAPVAAARTRDAAYHVAAADLLGYTRDTLLRDTDAMSMAHSLEVRVPFLDRAFVDWALRLPSAVRAPRPKALLAQAARGVLPPETLERRKRGFVVPFEAWLRGALRDEVDETLRRPPASLDGIVDWRAARMLWERYRDGGPRWTPAWSVYALARWAATLEEVR